MLFTSGEFLFVYLPLTLALFFLIARWAGDAAAAAWLVLASFVFYAYWLPVYTALLALSIVFNYTLGRWIAGCDAQHAKLRRLLLFVAVAANLAVLGYFKYANFFLDTLTALFGRSLGSLNVILPIGISFYTFTQIAYLVDVYAGKVKESNPLHYALFVTYFPHLIAGPILHHAEMMPQFALPHIYRPRLENFSSGFAFLLIGLAKKVLVADSWAPRANDVFDSTAGATLMPGSAWGAVLAYTLQIYFDFSGYSDMAVGLSLLIGVRLPFNFNSPYRATSIVEFWRCWHMTLSRFLRDYLYFALGGNRHGPVRRYANLLITMLLGGLWHGASWTFVIWGGLHGLYLMVNHAWRSAAERTARLMNRPLPGLLQAGGRGLAFMLTLLCVMVAWVFFRARGFEDAQRILACMFSVAGCAGTHGPPPGEGVVSSYRAGWITAMWFAASFAAAVVGRNSQQWVDGPYAAAMRRVSSSAWRTLALGAIIGAEVTAIAMLALISASRSVTEFIYFNF
jgi:D-alanyl-lipoteichoic acid acyltransferase DltB (MBOAT superfamily)